MLSATITLLLPKNLAAVQVLEAMYHSVVAAGGSLFGPARASDGLFGVRIVDITELPQYDGLGVSSSREAASPSGGQKRHLLDSPDTVRGSWSIVRPRNYPSDR